MDETPVESIMRQAAEAGIDIIADDGVALSTSKLTQAIERGWQPDTSGFKEYWEQRG